VRVEALLAADRTWSPADWVERYLDHPVTGTLGRRLIWQTSSDGGGWVAGLPERADGGWRLSGRPLGDRIRVWHPLDADAGEIATWRNRVTASGLRQPFKQAFRETYRLTPAEEESDLFSHRYAGHVLMYRRASALMRTRGWQASYLGTWDGGYQSEATKVLGEWRASFFHHAVDGSAHSYRVEFCGTDQVRIARLDGTQWTVARLADVPARVFSEAMRDVDLFVGVTSIATDDGWAERTDDPLFRYWLSASVGPLSAQAEIRREALARILPMLAIADRCELAGRYLRVRGTRRTYRIHLGSGNILMEPDDAYLCIVPAKPSGPSVRLPFDDDPMLTLVLSKAILLAADDRITDPSILRQIS
jgi:hypothetical protein